MSHIGSYTSTLQCQKGNGKEKGGHINPTNFNHTMREKRNWVPKAGTQEGYFVPVPTLLGGLALAIQSKKKLI